MFVIIRRNITLILALAVVVTACQKKVDLSSLKEQTVARAATHLPELDKAKQQVDKLLERAAQDPSTFSPTFVRQLKELQSRIAGLKHACERFPKAVEVASTAQEPRVAIEAVSDSLTQQVANTRKELERILAAARKEMTKPAADDSLKSESQQSAATP